MDKRYDRCTVCGAVFEHGIDVCPVCGADSDRFEPMKSPQAAFRRDTGGAYLILGGGVAAVSAAEAIRARDDTACIAILTDEPRAPYNRPMLTRVLGSRGSAAYVKKPGWYADNRVNLYTGLRIRSMDPEKREVALDDGQVFCYDKCIYALGAECFVPPIPGADGKNCVCIRRMSDIERIEHMLETAKSAAVIGGGVLGLEAAWALKQRGLSVSVIEAENRLMPRQLTEDVSARLKAAAEEHGVGIVTGARVLAITDRSVELADGAGIPADIVILSCGIRANAAIARDAGLSVERAVVVDEHMRTSEKDVYACGDCAEYQSVDMGLWPEASEQGRIAGANASGDGLTYHPQKYPVSFMGFGLRLFDGQIK